APRQGEPPGEAAKPAREPNAAGAPRPPRETRTSSRPRTTDKPRTGTPRPAGPSKPPPEAASSGKSRTPGVAGPARRAEPSGASSPAATSPPSGGSMPSRGPVASREVELPGHAERSRHGAAFRGSEPSAGGAADLAATGGGATGRGPMVDLAKVARGSAGGGAARRVSGAGVFRDGRAADAGLPGDPGVPPQVRVGWHPAPGERTIAPAAAVVAGGALAVAGAGYLGWRASRLGGTGATGAVAFTAEVSLYLVLVGLAACLSRANRGFARRAPAPAGTLDVFVVSRGEPIADVDRSLRAARAITYPHRTFLLVDSRIDDATTPGGRGAARALVALAGRLDVACLVRDEGPPSRTAMLNGALARTDGDAVLLLDAG